MKIEPSWRRIAGFHIEGDGTVAVVWLAHDLTTDRVYLYDCALFKREVLAVISDRLKGWIPIAWEQSAEEIAKQLKQKGCKFFYEGYKDTPAAAEVNAREIWQRMRAGTFKVFDTAKEWIEERKRFLFGEDARVPQEGFPLMSATRHAMSQLSRAQQQGAKQKINYDARGIV